MIIPKLPLPNNDRVIDVLTKIIPEIIMKIIDVAAQDASKVDSINDNSSLSNIDHIFKIFEEFRKSAKQSYEKVENVMKSEVSYWVDAVTKTVTDKESISEKYGINIGYIKKRMKEILEGINGAVDFELSKNVSLDNYKCREIMKMPSGDKRQEEMQIFLNDSIHSSINSCCEKIKTALLDALSEISEEMTGAVEEIQKHSEYSLNQLRKIAEDNYDEITAKVINQAYCVIDVCTITGDILKGA